MRQQKASTTEEILSKLENQNRNIVEKLQILVKKTIPEAVETVKWGNITYLLHDRNLAWIIIYADHVDFGFFRGAELKSKLLEGTGKGLRHIKISQLEDIEEAEITRLLKDAVRLESAP